jgi:Family of unknown function (DUF5336)
MPDFKAMARHDQIALGSGALVFIASFLPWYGVKFKGSLAGFAVGNTTTDAWHGLAAFGLILSLLALAVTAAELLAKDSLPELPVSYPIVAAGLASLGALFVVIKSFDLPGGSGPGFSVGLRWGGYILIILILVQAVISVMRVVHSGGKSAPPAPTI